MGESIVVLLIFAGSAMVAISFSTIGQAIARRIAGRPAGESESRMLAEIDELRASHAELAERLDFAERQLVGGAPPRPLTPTPEA